MLYKELVNQWGDGVYDLLLEKASDQEYLPEDGLTGLYTRENRQSINSRMQCIRSHHLGIYDEEEDESILEEIGYQTNKTDNHLASNEINVDDTVGLYLKEMSQVSLLTLEEELNLSELISAGKIAYNMLMKSNGNMPAEKRLELEAKIQEGIHAREHLVKANTRLVVSIAKKYLGKGVAFLDLIQEGNLGLMKAAEKYDHRRGCRFSTYATWWIRQTVTRAIADQGRTIRVPVHMIDRIRKLNKITHNLEQTLGRPPTADELAGQLGCTRRKLLWLLRVSWLPLSLETPVGDEEDSELGMFVEDTYTPTPTQCVYNSLLREKIEQVLDTLSPRESRIIRMRFGFDNGHAYTLEEVGLKFGLTRERIRQIEGRALSRLRHPRRSRQLKEYL